MHLFDGTIQAFLYEDVDSITYSYSDIDGYTYDDVMFQKVWAFDSCYCYYLPSIDSISFVTPETRYKDNVVNIDATLAQYITGSDETHLFISSSVPGSLLPQVGETVVNSTRHPGFSRPFAGKVVAVTSNGQGYEVLCETVALTDIFECYYGVATATDDATDKATTRALKDKDVPIDLPLSYNWDKDLLNMTGVSAGYEFNDNLAASIQDIRIRGSYRPNLKITGYTIVKDGDISLGLSVNGQHTFGTEIALSGSMTVKNEWEVFSKTFPIPEALIEIQVKFGFFAEMSSKINCKTSAETVFNQDFHWSWSSRNLWPSEDRNEFKQVSSKYDGELSIDGSNTIGGFASATASFLCMSDLDVAEISLTGKAGIKFEGHGVISDTEAASALSSTDLYHKLSDQGSNRLALYYGSEIGGKLFKWSVSYTIPNWLGIPFGKEIELYKENLVPEFSDVMVNEDGEKRLSASATVKGLSLPSNVGFCLQDMNQNIVSKSLVYEYLGLNNAHGYNYDFENIDLSDQYVLYPMVRYHGIDMIADPSAKYLSGVDMYCSIISVGDNFAKISVTCNCKAEGYKWGIRYSSNRHDWTMLKGEDFSEAPSGAALQYGDFLIQGLSNSTTYYVEPYCIFNGKTVYGETKEIQTCFVKTLSASAVDIYSAKLNGQAKGNSISSYGFEFKKKGGSVQSYKASSADSDGKFSYSINQLEEKTEYSYRAYAWVSGGSDIVYGDWISFTTGEIEEVDEKDFTPGDLIDLGLSVKWSSKNLGADKMTDFGDYYQWGITVPCYQDHVNNRYRYEYYDDTYKSFINIGSDISGSSRYDAATSRWGGNWKMPTASQAAELCTKCEWHYVHFKTMYGMKVVGPNGNSVFIPVSTEKFPTNGVSFWTATAYDWTKQDSFFSAGEDLTDWMAYDFSVNFLEGYGSTINDPYFRAPGALYSSPQATERYRGLRIRPVSR